MLKRTPEQIFEELSLLESETSRNLAEEKQEILEEEESDEEDYFKNLDEDSVERFIDGLLLVLAELESEGTIPPIHSTKEAKDAMMAVVRKIYQSRSTIQKMSSKYRRYGSSRILRTARTAITKALS